MNSWHQSYQYQQSCLCLCIFIDHRLVYNNCQYSQAFQNKLYKSEDIFANQDATIHEAQLCRACDYSDAI